MTRGKKHWEIIVWLLLCIGLLSVVQLFHTTTTVTESGKKNGWANKMAYVEYVDKNLQKTSIPEVMFQLTFSRILAFSGEYKQLNCSTNTFIKVY